MHDDRPTEPAATACASRTQAEGQSPAEEARRAGGIPSISNEAEERLFGPLAGDGE